MAVGTDTINSIGGAVSDLFAADAHRSRAQGLRIEGQDYDLASGFATQNEKFTETSTAIKQAQLDRSIYQTMGGQQADVAGAGFASSGSAIDLLRDSASQGALTKAVGEQQGLITEEGYNVQAQTYTNMGNAARIAAGAEDEAATASDWGAAFKGAAAVASVASIFLKT
jgi:hypothetical protein